MITDKTSKIILAVASSTNRDTVKKQRNQRQSILNRFGKNPSRTIFLYLQFELASRLRAFENNLRDISTILYLVNEDLLRHGQGCSTGDLRVQEVVEEVPSWTVHEGAEGSQLHQPD